MTQVDLAAASGVTQGAISQIEKGRITPTIDTLAKIAVAVDAPFADLLRPSQVEDVATEAARLARLGGVEGGLGLIRLGVRMVSRST